MLMTYVLAVLGFFPSRKDDVMDDYRMRMYRIWAILGYRGPSCLLRQFMVFSSNTQKMLLRRVLKSGTM